MRLKRILLKGFKSFADRTEILFDQGITVVVGPNGCGKSNVVDAFRWVMGEQSAKSLRGDKMPDVIFAGSTTRRTAEHAEVTLTFSEVANELPVPYDEVEVTRRLHRSGESEYFLNGNSVRQRDIHSLFWDSALGKDAFAIFEQGKIEEIILLSPTDRREIFDQVAGIKRFRERRKEALRKLTQMEGNLSRLQDMLREEQRRLKGLERQVAAATRYRDQRDRLKDLEQGILYSKWNVEERNRKEAAEALAGLDMAQREQKEVGAEHERQAQQLKEWIAKTEEQLKERTQKLYSLQSNQQVRSVQQESHDRRLEESKKRLEELQRQLEQVEQAERKDSQTALLTENSVSAWLKTEVEAQASLRSAEELAEGVQQEVDALRQQQRAALQHGDSLMTVLHTTQSRVRECQLRLEADLRHLKEFENEHHGLQARLEQVAQSIKGRREGVAELSLAIDQRKKTLLEMTGAFEAHRQEVRVAREELERLTTTLAESRARQQVLRRMHEEGEGFSAGAKLLLQESADASSDFFGVLCPLYEAVTIPVGREVSVAGLLARYSQTLVAKDERGLNLVIARARELKLTDISLATAATIERLVLDMDVVEEEELRPGSVTSQGLFLDERGVLFFPVKGERSSIVREAELRQLTPWIQAGQTRSAELDLQLTQFATITQTLRSQREELEKVQRRDEMKLVEVNFMLQQAISNEREDGHRIQKVAAELQQLTEQQETLRSELAILMDQEVIAKKDLTDHRNGAMATEAQLQDALTKLRRYLEAVRQKDAEYQAAVRGRQESHRQHEELRNRELERKRQLERLSDQKQQITGNLERLRELIAQSRAESQDTVGLIREVELNVKDLTEQLKKNKEQQTILDRQRAAWIEAQTLEAQQAHRLELILAQHASMSSALEQELQKRFGCGMLDLHGIHLDIPLNEAEAEVQRLRGELGASDSVNLGAVEEFEIQQKGLTTLAQQVEDLVSSRRELNKFISGLDRTSRKQFKESFERVRLNFQEQFRTLFEGGEADLIFTDSDDVLEAGIDIVAKPPGKQLRSINLLSGGEKCLTAMALLFGMFQVKPAPFCILDEMDAPLDDSNIARFLQVLSPFMAQTQFIIVTHNKRTMAVADRLVGVSMEEKGVSKLISVSFERERIAELNSV